MNLELHLKIVGALFLFLFVLNLIVPFHFGWKQELKQVSLLTRNVFFVHGFFIAMSVLAFGLLCLFFTETLIERSTLATLVLGFLTTFWVIRLYMQWFVYDRTLWRGLRFETWVHFVFTAQWAYITAVFGVAFWRQVQDQA